VSEASDGWLHALLVAVKARVGAAALINTSFNARGRPILNTAAEALEMLQDCDELDFVVVEEWLFSKASVAAAEAAEDAPRAAWC